MIVQRKMANVKLKHHTKVQSPTIKAQSRVSKYQLFGEIVLFCDPLYMNVTLSSVCVSLCLMLSEPDHISRLLLQDHIFSVPRDLVGEVRYQSASLYEVVSRNNHLKPLKVSCTLMHHDSTRLKRRRRSSRIFPAASSKLIFKSFSCKSKPKGQLLQISTIHQCFCDKK